MVYPGYIIGPNDSGIDTLSVSLESYGDLC
jgi:hypothetical protein